MFSFKTSLLRFSRDESPPAFSRSINPDGCSHSVASKLVSGATSSFDHPYFVYLNRPKPQYVSTLKKSPQKLELPLAKDIYTSAKEYVDTFEQLIDREEEFHRKTAESWIIKDVEIQWELVGLKVGNLRGFFTLPEEQRKRGQLTLDTRFKITLDTWTTEAVIELVEDGGFHVFCTERRPPPQHGNFTLQKTFSNFSYFQLKQGLHRFCLSPSDFIFKTSLSKEVASAILGHGNPNNSIKNCLSPIKTANLDKFNLNISQRRAAEDALGDSPISLILGPPGTGKTMISVAIISQLVQNAQSGEKILVCAPSNTAVDNLTLKLIQAGIQGVIRAYSDNRERTQKIHPDLQDITLLTKALAKSYEFERSARRLLSSYQDSSDDDDDFKQETKYDFEEAMRNDFPNKPYYFVQLHRKIDENEPFSVYERKAYQHFKEKFGHEVLGEGKIICCTCSAAENKLLKNFTFPYVFIDEAAQSSEPETLIPITLGAKKVILVGDHQQLGPIFACEEAKNAGLDRSLFERLLPRIKHEMLDTQYRMHSEIAEFPSENFYKGKLKTHPSVQLNHMKNSISSFRSKPLRFIHTEGLEEKLQTSWINPTEKKSITQFLKILLEKGVDPMNIGIITAYSKQKEILQSEISIISDKVKIASVDEFQGGEKDYILLSTVRSNTKNKIGFLHDERRLNVAITRAKYGLIIFGNANLLKCDENWKKLIKFCQSKDCLQNEKFEPIKIFKEESQSQKKNEESQNQSKNEESQNQSPNKESIAALLDRMKKLMIQKEAMRIKGLK